MSNLMKLKELAKVQNAAALTERIQRSEKARHRGLTAHARARYRCFLPDLAGLAGVRRVRPMPDLNHSSIRGSWAPAGLQGGRRTICDFWCKNRPPRPSLLVAVVEQCLNKLLPVWIV